MYRVFLERAAEKDLKGLSSKLHNRVLKALQILPLIRIAWEAEIAFAALLRCCGVLHTGFARANLGELALDVA